MIFRLVLLVSLILFAAFLVVIGITNTPFFYESGDDAPVVTQLPPATAVTQLPSVTATPKTSWLILPTLPASATQADAGAEIYRLVCRDCHGDKGQGLTDEWRATWNPEHQNCWQSKCHASNHPVNGFDLPRFVPAIIGPSTLARFGEPAELHEYLQSNMPWYDPGSLTGQEYWQLVAFLVRENGGDPIEMP